MYVLDKIGKIIERIDLECSDDAEAVSDAKTFARTNDVEIWRGQEVVTILHPLA